MLSGLRPHNETGHVYWIEGRPLEKGRKVPVRYDPSTGKSVDVLKAPFASRTAVHEYGGGDYVLTENGSLVFSNWSDQRLYIARKDASVDAQPVPISPETKAVNVLRYADGAIDNARHRVYAVHEDHTTVQVSSTGAHTGQPTNSIVWCSLSGATPSPLASAKPAAPAVVDSKASVPQPKVHVIASGHDFYSSPRLNPAGTQLCYLAWDHPNMPWDSSMLYVVNIAADGSFSKPIRVAGVEGDALTTRDVESITEPSYGPDGTLYFVSDRQTGWWNLHRAVAAAAAGGDVKQSSYRVECVCKHQSEFAGPQWIFGNKSYDFIDAKTILAVHGSSEKGGAVLAFVHVDSGKFTDLDENMPFTSIDTVSYCKGKAYFLGSAPGMPMAVIEYNLSTKSFVVLQSSMSVDLSKMSGYVSIPRPVEFPTENHLTAHAYYYRPYNVDYNHSGLDGEKPPLLVKIHGGPTAAANTRCRLDIQYWTSRGFAVLDVNYGGSTGHGRAYRQRLNNNWGVMDVNDCCNGALFCVAQGWADRDRLLITGGSAGGFTSMAALVFRPDVFRAGGAHYGVADLTALARDTHKFEARYLDALVAPYPAGQAIYDARSPLVHINKLKRPIILFQGLDDKVVPPEQTTSMYEAIKKKGLPVSCVMFEGEGHGWRQAKNIRAALDGEFYFYAQLFGYEPADKIDSPPKIDNPGYKVSSKRRDSSLLCMI